MRTPQTDCSILSHSGNVPGSATVTTMATVVTIEMMRSRRNTPREPRAARVAADSRMSAVATTMIDRTQAGPLTSAGWFRSRITATRAATPMPR